MRPWQKRTIIVLCVVLAACLAALAVSRLDGTSGGTDQPNGTVISPNTVVYQPKNPSGSSDANDSGNASPFDILSVAEDGTVVVSGENTPQEGSVLVAGVTDATPHGLLRRVVSATPGQDDQVVLATEQAALTDAIERCDIDFSASVTQDGAYDVRTTDNLQSNAAASGILSQLVGLVAPASADAEENADDSTDSKLFEFDEDGVEASFEVNLEGKLQIQDGAANLRLVIHPEGEFSIGTGTLLEASNEGDPTELASFRLPNLEFAVAGVPVVITDELAVSYEYTHELKASLFDIHAKLDYQVGVQYAGGQGVSGVWEDDSEAPTVDLTPDSLGKVSLSMDDKLNFTLKPRLYGLAGFDATVALASKLDADASPFGAQNGVTVEEGGFAIGGLPGTFCGHLKEKVTLPISLALSAGEDTVTTMFKASLPDLLDRKGKLEWTSEPLFSSEDTITLLDVELSAENPATAVDISGVALANTATTTWGEANAITYPAFSVDYPDGWSVVDDAVTPTSEVLTLSDGNGAEVRVGYLAVLAAANADNGIWAEPGVTAELATASSFVPGRVQDTDLTGLGEFMVAYCSGTSDAGAAMEPGYAVLPRSWNEGEHLCTSDTRTYMPIFNYAGALFCYGRVPDDVTDEQRAQVVAILASFRVQG